MPPTMISNIINPEVLADQISAKFPDRLVLGQTDLVEVDSTFPLGSPGTVFKIPFWKRMATFSALSEGTAMSTNAITTGSEFAVVSRGGVAFEVTDPAQLVSKADPVGEIADQIARRAAEFIDANLVTELEKTPNAFDQTVTQVDAVQTLTPNALISALVTTIGDNYSSMLQGGAIILHSKVFGDLLKNGSIQNQYQSGMDVLKTGMIPTLLGLPVFLSDRVTINVVSATNQYHTYIVGRGALGLFYQRQVMVEFDRDILKKTDLISADVHFASHLFGYDDQGAAVVAEQNKSIHAISVNSK
jgi:hypothetical protein